MNPAFVALLSVSGLGAGMLGLVDGMPALAGGGFAITVGLQLWTTLQLQPIKVKQARMEEREIARDERLIKLEEQITGRRRGQGHKTPPVFDD